MAAASFTGVARVMGGAAAWPDVRSGDEVRPGMAASVTAAARSIASLARRRASAGTIASPRPAVVGVDPGVATGAAGGSEGVADADAGGGIRVDVTGLADD